MLTKYVLTIGNTEHLIPDECLKNWDEIAFSLKRTDYSGVMRSFSTDFVFVGDIKDLLWDLYLDYGFLAEASVAVYTITNKWEWEKQYEAALDFSTIEVDEGTLSINALDNTLGSLLKSKRSQKYEYKVDDFSTLSVYMTRLELRSNGVYTFYHESNLGGVVTALYNDKSSTIISEEYVSLVDEVNASDSTELDKGTNRFFATVNKSGLSVSVRVKGYVRCWFCPYTKDNSVSISSQAEVEVSYLNIWKLIDSGGTNVKTIVGTLTCDDIRHKQIHGNVIDIFVNKYRQNTSSDFAPFSNLAALKAEAASKWGQMGSEYNGVFGVVGLRDNPNHSEYWQQNTVYEYQNGQWIDKGIPENYYQDRDIGSGVAGHTGNINVSVPSGNDGTMLCLEVDDENQASNGKIFISEGKMYVEWGDPIGDTLDCRGITPQELGQKIVDSITGGGYTVSIQADTAGVLANTLIVPGEELRRIAEAKIYTTFGDFANWMEAVFGYTYRIVGDELQFVHRSEVFNDTVVKTIDSFNNLKYATVDDLIYTEVDAGYSKKEYGEIDGRKETNFTNYYSTGYALTNNKLSLISKYRSDSYGIEFTIRKGESETTDDKADEDVFFIRNTIVSNINYYRPWNQLTYYGPSVCVNNNKGFIAALGNGAAVTLTMTSSDGANALQNVVIAANSNLFTAGEIEFTTDDMKLPSDLNALVQLDYKGFRYKGFIREADARYGKVNGVEYTLIVKEITELL